MLAQLEIQEFNILNQILLFENKQYMYLPNTHCTVHILDFVGEYIYLDKPIDCNNNMMIPTISLFANETSWAKKAIACKSQYLSELYTFIHVLVKYHHNHNIIGVLLNSACIVNDCFTRLFKTLGPI